MADPPLIVTLALTIRCRPSRHGSTARLRVTCPPDDVIIWYTTTAHEGQEVISVQHVSLDT
jgi:hypothetical protein